MSRRKHSIGILVFHYLYAMTLNDWIKITLNLFIGCLTLILQSFIPVGGGGIISSIVYFWLVKKKKYVSKNVVIYSVMLLNLFITFGMYPYAD